VTLPFLDFRAGHSEEEHRDVAGMLLRLAPILFFLPTCKVDEVVDERTVQRCAHRQPSHAPFKSNGAGLGSGGGALDALARGVILVGDGWTFVMH
jgi:hypothetical protein